MNPANPTTANPTKPGEKQRNPSEATTAAGEINEDLLESIRGANEELKRVEHLVYVSLKYTRTVDVIQNILQRMVDAYEHMTDALIKKKQIDADEGIEGAPAPESIIMPDTAVERAELAQELYEEDISIQDNIELYLLLRKLLRAKGVERENEYRRHVTMKTIIDGREEIVNIDIITNYYLFQREFLEHLHKMVGLELQKKEGTFY